MTVVAGVGRGEKKLSEASVSRCSYRSFYVANLSVHALVYDRLKCTGC